MSNWAPKPLRPQAENPLFQMDESYTITTKMTPIQQQRMMDGTPHTKTGPTRLGPGTVPTSQGGPDLYIGKALPAKEDTVEKSVDADAVVKAFMNKDDEDTEKAGVGEKAANAVVGAAKVGAKAAGAVARTSVGLASQR